MRISEDMNNEMGMGNNRFTEQSQLLSWPPPWRISNGPMESWLTTPESSIIQASLVSTNKLTKRADALTWLRAFPDVAVSEYV